MSTSIADGLDAIKKILNDLAEIVGLVKTSLPRGMPWQRKLLTCLADVDGTIQILRMTIAMERADVEILEAAADVHSACRRAELSIVGTRADAPTKASVRMAVQLSQGISVLLQRVGSDLSKANEVSGL